MVYSFLAVIFTVVNPCLMFRFAFVFCNSRTLPVMDNVTWCQVNPKSRLILQGDPDDILVEFDIAALEVGEV